MDVLSLLGIFLEGRKGLGKKFEKRQRGVRVTQGMIRGVPAGLPLEETRWKREAQSQPMVIDEEHPPNLKWRS